MKMNDANTALLERDAEHLIHPLHSRAMHSAGGKVWVRGEGAVLIDANGDRYLDGLAGLWNNTAGNGRQELADAAAKQMLELGYASGYTGSSNPQAIALADESISVRRSPEAYYVKADALRRAGRVTDAIEALGVRVDETAAQPSDAGMRDAVLAALTTDRGAHPAAGVEPTSG